MWNERKPQLGANSTDCVLLRINVFTAALNHDAIAQRLGPSAAITRSLWPELVIGQAKHVGQTELVGFVFAFAGIGSLIGGLMLGPAAAARLERALPAMLIVQSVLISIIYSSGSLTSTALWLFGANLFFAPSLGCLYVLIGTSPLVQRKLDVLAWMFSTNIGGIAIGNYVSGLIIHSWSPRLPFLVRPSCSCRTGWRRSRKFSGCWCWP